MDSHIGGHHDPTATTVGIGGPGAEKHVIGPIIIFKALSI
jgi:hypothetical protein